MSAAKTLIATGVSSGLGFEVIRQLLLDSPTSWRMFLGVRDPPKTKGELADLKYDTGKHDIALFKVDYINLPQVRSFAKEALAALGTDKLDYVLLNHGMSKHGNEPAWEGSKWSDEYIVNHESHHYLMHLLRNKIAESHSRVVFVSSGAIRGVKDTSTLDDAVKAGADTDQWMLYSSTKFQHLLGAHHWRRQLGDKATVVAVSPGMIPGTNLGRHNPPEKQIPSNHPDAKDIPTGARSIWAAATRNDIPKDPNAIFLTSWGEWWDPNEIYPLSLDKELQDKWCRPQEEIEKDMGPE